MLGRESSPIVRRRLVGELSGDDQSVSDSALAAAQWIAADPRRRADALHDLLLLADELPAGKRDGLHFPRIDSTEK